MLPSTGYFKTINCPFYENGSCDRPYCHFKHSRREDVGSTGGPTGTVETRTSGQIQEPQVSSVATPDSDVFQQLVTEAVKKVLASRDVSTTDGFSDNVVCQVVEGLKPNLASGSSTAIEAPTATAIGKRIEIPPPVNKPVPCVYNPTPIAELKKRHIPIISYMPTRDSRITVKRKSSPDGPKPWLSIVNESNDSPISEIRYKPTTIVGTVDRDPVQSYVPTSKTEPISNPSEDGNSSDYLLKLGEEYYPKSKKRREEYVPKKVKAPLKTVERMDKTVLGEFQSEFDVLDQILTSTQIPCAPSSEESQDSCLEPKFSDDDEPLEAATYAPVKEKEPEQERKLQGNDKVPDNKAQSPKVLGTVPDSISKSRQHEKLDEKVDSHGKNKDCTGDGRKENKSKDRSRDRREKSRGSSHRSSKDRHKKSESNAHEKKRSISHSSDKDRSRDRSSSKNSKRSEPARKDRRDKHKDKKSKKDHRDYEKRHDRRETKRDSSRTRDRAKERGHQDRKQSSRSSRKIDDSSSKRSSKYKENHEERTFSNDDNYNDDCYIFEDDDVVLSISDSDHDVQEECLKIFQEYQVSKRSQAASPKVQPASEPEQSEEIGRKRVAHPSAATNVTRQQGPSQTAKKLSNPQQKMYERWRLLRNAAAEQAAEKAKEKATDSVAQTPPGTCKDSRVEETSVPASNNDVQINGNGRIRIAHVPYARSLAMEKRKVADTAKKIAESKAADKTAAQTAKSGVRVAHVPQTVPQLIHPEPLQVTTQKFPLNVRQYYVNMMHNVCFLIYTNAEDAAQRAVKEEFACHERCKALAVYKSSCMLATHRLRKEVDQTSSTEDVSAATSGTNMMSHEAVLAGKSKGSWSVLKRKKSVTEFRGVKLYEMLKKWILTEQQLKDNGFPRPHPDGQKGRAKVYVINSRNQAILSKVPNERNCTRCGRAYMIDKQGLAVRQENCIYHWGKKFTIRGQGKYSCCQQYGSATGCCDAKSHVWEYVDYENLRGYVKTLPKDIPIEEQGVYALDCEMTYTTQGLELTRITVINEDCNVVYETLVKPTNPIIDYNTRFSGITEENMTNVTTTLLDVQATLLTMFSEHTILVGHSLESDFKALKLLHDTVVDTSVMFPHKNGHPQKRALKNLCSEYLRKIIQNDVGGHDSKEDAVACMELILWKAKEEAKLQ